MSQSRWSTKSLVVAALCVALSVVLSYIKVYRMPQGGSVTLEMLPLMVLAFTHGPLWGFFGGAVSGLIQLFFGGYFLSLPQVILDYPLAFGLVGFSGLIRHPWVLGALLGGVLRYAAAVASGVIFFASYAPEGQSALTYSLVYNASYMVPALIVTVAALFLVLPPLRRWLA